MPKQKVSASKFIELCNAELKSHPDYQEGMEIVGVPASSSASEHTGYGWKGPDPMPSIAAQIIRKVSANFEPE